MPITSPSDIASNLLWVSGQRNVTDDGSGNVTQWNNQNGSDHLSVINSTAPRTGVNSLNGHNVITFSGGSLCSAVDLATGGQPFSIAVHFLLDDNTNTNTRLIIGNRQFTSWWVAPFSSNLFVNAPTGQLVGAFQQNTFHRLIVNYDGASSAAWFDGTKINLPGDPGANSAAGICLGGASSGFFTDVQIASASFFNAALTDTQASDLDAWMVAEYAPTITITSVNGGLPIRNLQTNVPVVGSGFTGQTTATIAGTAQTAFPGAGATDTNASFTAVRPNNLPYNLSADFAISGITSPVSLIPQTNWEVVTLVAPLLPKAQRFDNGQSFDVAPGDQVAYDASTGATINPDGSVSSLTTPIVFEAEVFDSSDNTWGTSALITFNGVVSSTASLVAQDSQVAGTSSGVMSSTGALAAQASQVAGISSVAGVITSTGALAAQDSQAAGTSTQINASTGALAAQAAQMAGASNVVGIVNSTGNLLAQEAEVAGISSQQGITTSTGSLLSQASQVAGTSTQTGTVTSTGALVSQNSQVAGADSPIIVGQNSYVSLAQANAYFQLAIHASAWRAADNATKEAALYTATLQLERQDWEGSKTDANQPLQWPRTGVSLCDGTVIDPNTVPLQIQQAQMELALQLVLNPTSVNNATTGSNIRRVSAARGTDVEFFRPTLGTRFPTIVQELINQFRKGACNGSAVGNASFGTGGTSAFSDGLYDLTEGYK